MKVRLLDVNLIIVGDGPRAELLLERRLAAGGRVCLLHTSQPAKPQQSCSAAAEAEKTVEEEEGAQDLEDELEENMEPMFHEDSFIWDPPEPQTAPSTAVRSLQRRFRCRRRGLIRIGPDIVDLETGQWYELMRDGRGRPTGVRVLQSQPGEPNKPGQVTVVWQMSGGVLLADNAAPGNRSKSWQQLRGSLVWAQAADVEVIAEDAKPAMVMHRGNPAYCTVYFVVCMIIFYLPSIRLEPELQPGQFAWWRVVTTPWILVVLPLQLHRAISETYLGFDPGRRAVPVRVAAVVAYCLCPIPGMFILGGYYHVPYFVVLLVMMETWTLVELYLMHSLYRENQGSKPCQSPPETAAKPKDFKKQLLFTCMLNWSRSLIQATMWLITLAYGRLEPWNSYAAGLFLTTTTSTAELTFVAALQAFYDRLVWRPRADHTAEQAVVGDQMEYFSGLLAFAHGICESVRLTNLLATAILSNDWRWSWLGTVAMIFAGNVSQRYGLHTYVFTLLLPKRFLHLVRPGCVAMMHRHARFHAGYYRFLGVLGFIAVNAIGQQLIPGRTTKLLFNEQALILAGVLFVFELLEDAVVALNFLPLDPWRSRMSEHYAKLHTLHIKQLLCKDSRGLSNRTPLRLHGARYLTNDKIWLLYETGALMLMVFLWVPLGIGFTFGICPEPIPQDLRVLDALDVIVNTAFFKSDVHSDVAASKRHSRRVLPYAEADARLPVEGDSSKVDAECSFAFVTRLGIVRVANFSSLWFHGDGGDGGDGDDIGGGVGAAAAAAACDVDAETEAADAVNSRLARAGKVKNQTPKVAKAEKKKVLHYVWQRFWPVLVALFSASCCFATYYLVKVDASMQSFLRGPPSECNYWCGLSILLWLMVGPFILAFHLAIMAILLLAPAIICLTAFAVIFPVLCKLKIGDVEDSLLFCLTLPSGAVVGSNAYMWPPYMILVLKGLHDVLLAKWNSHDTVVVEVFDKKIMSVHIWLGTQVLDLYTDLAALLAMLGRVQPWCQIIWALTCVPSASVVLAVAMFPVTDEVLWRYRLIQVFSEDIAQLSIAFLGLFDRTVSADMNQYVLYSLLTNLLGALASLKLVLTSTHAQTALRKVGVGDYMLISQHEADDSDAEACVPQQGDHMQISLNKAKSKEQENAPSVFNQKDHIYNGLCPEMAAWEPHTPLGPSDLVSVQPKQTAQEAVLPLRPSSQKMLTAKQASSCCSVS
ncbi:unnamed protein product [Symbiodinium microadriaticum]|nr:unnamed protein product [Symbiodinium microadriaticum]